MMLVAGRKPFRDILSGLFSICFVLQRSSRHPSPAYVVIFSFKVSPVHSAFVFPEHSD